MPQKVPSHSDGIDSALNLSEEAYPRRDYILTPHLLRLLQKLHHKLRATLSDIWLSTQRVPIQFAEIPYLGTPSPT
ncbi:MAG: hypothetical protein LBE38_07315 [Deltaproteobacteria bacterium]|jgi:hypothetical protein|nr:hypothetical protein [Deltaproteobacteria bacterium]